MQLLSFCKVLKNQGRPSSSNASTMHRGLWVGNLHFQQIRTLYLVHSVVSLWVHSNRSQNKQIQSILKTAFRWRIACLKWQVCTLQGRANIHLSFIIWKSVLIYFHSAPCGTELFWSLLGEEEKYHCKETIYHEILKVSGKKTQEISILKPIQSSFTWNCF